MKNQALFSSKDKRKKLKCRLLQFLFGALRVNTKFNTSVYQRTDRRMKNIYLLTYFICRDVMNVHRVCVHKN